jgi:pyruvate/2-oxoglutarate dehydrogenase complex dihydrolipoamide acyltransferase (E2) component
VTAPTTVADHRPRHRHSPRVRRLARAVGVDLEHVTGTGPGGRILPVDVTAATRPDAASGPSATATDSSNGDGGTVTFHVLELDLTAVPETAQDRVALLGALAHTLLAAVRRVRPVTDVEIASGETSTLIHRAHDLTRAALTARLTAPDGLPATVPPDAAEQPRIAVRDNPTASGALLTAPAPGPGRLLAATIGPVQVRPAALPTSTGWPDITFRPTALLAVGSRDSDLTDAEITGILSAVASRALCAALPD